MYKQSKLEEFIFERICKLETIISKEGVANIDFLTQGTYLTNVKIYETITGRTHYEKFNYINPKHIKPTLTDGELRKEH